MTQFEKTLDELQDVIVSNVPGLWTPLIENFLPIEEIAKKIIMSKNPTLTSKYADYIIKGVNIATDSLSQVDFGSITSKIQEGVGNLNLGEIQNLVQDSISKLELGDVKNLLVSRFKDMDISDIQNILQNKLGEVDLDFAQSFVQGQLDSIDINLAKSLLLDSVKNLDSVGIQNFVQGGLATIDSKLVDSYISDGLKKIKGVIPKPGEPIPKLQWNGKQFIKEEAKKLKAEMKKVTFMLMKEQQEIVKDITVFGIQAGTSIAGAAVLISPLSFNVPAAISIVLTLFDGISKLISRMTNIINYVEPLKKLPLVLPDELFDQLTAPLIVSLKTLTSLMGIIGVLQSLLGSVMGSLKSQTSPSKTTSQQNQLAEQIRQKEGELATLQVDGAPKEDIDLKIEEIEELKSRLETMRSEPQLPMDENGNFVDLNSLSLDPLVAGSFEKIKNSINQATAVNQDLVGFIYDAYYPDGTIRRDLSEEQIEEIKLKYEVVYDPSADPAVK